MLATRYSLLATSSACVSGFPLVEGGDDLGLDILVEGGLCADFGEERVFAGSEEIADRDGGGGDLLDVETVVVALLESEDRHGLELDGDRAEGGLLEEFDDAAT